MLLQNFQVCSQCTVYSDDMYNDLAQLNWFHGVNWSWSDVFRRSSQFLTLIWIQKRDYGADHSQNLVIFHVSYATDAENFWVILFTQIWNPS